MTSNMPQSGKVLVICSEQILNRRFLHFSVVKDEIERKISLFAWEEVQYRHPDVDPLKVEVGVPVIEERHVVSYTMGSNQAGALEAFDAAHRGVREQVRQHYNF